MIWTNIRYAVISVNKEADHLAANRVNHALQTFPWCSETLERATGQTKLKSYPTPIICMRYYHSDPGV
jgi:hypothetical protein